MANKVMSNLRMGAKSKLAALVGATVMAGCAGRGDSRPDTRVQKKVVTVQYGHSLFADSTVDNTRIYALRDSAASFADARWYNGTTKDIEIRTVSQADKFIRIDATDANGRNIVYLCMRNDMNRGNEVWLGLSDAQRCELYARAMRQFCDNAEYDIWNNASMDSVDVRSVDISNGYVCALVAPRGATGEDKMVELVYRYDDLNIGNTDWLRLDAGQRRAIHWLATSGLQWSRNGTLFLYLECAQRGK